ncbi:MAG: hypothetical protein ABIQ39_02960 [Ilumatobacteraceae bacterium]
MPQHPDVGTRPGLGSLGLASPGLASPGLVGLGLRAGEPVRFRKLEHSRWLSGKLSSVAPDGSITVFDANGAARSLRPERIEVRRPSGRGRLSWQLLSEVAVTWEQLELW